MLHYWKLKQEKVVNLFSNNAIKTVVNGRNTTFTFDLPYHFSTFSKNAEMNVVSVSYENVDSADDNAIFIFRILEVNNDDVFDSTSGMGSVVYHSRGFSNENDMNKPVFRIQQPLNRITLTVTNSLTNRDNGVNAGDFFIMTLVVRDYDVEEVEPSAMPRIESYSHIPQMKIKY